MAIALKGKAILEVDKLKKYLLERKKRKPGVPTPGQNKSIAKPAAIKIPAVILKPLQQPGQQKKLRKENSDAIHKFNSNWF